MFLFLSRWGQWFYYIKDEERKQGWIKSCISRWRRETAAVATGPKRVLRITQNQPSIQMATISHSNKIPMLIIFMTGWFIRSYLRHQRELTRLKKPCNNNRVWSLLKFATRGVPHQKNHVLATKKRKRKESNDILWGNTKTEALETEHVSHSL